MSKNLPARTMIRLSSGLLAFVAIFAATQIARAQTYRDQPILISDESSTRALATNAQMWRGNRLPLATQEVFPAGEATRITMFVHNLNLMVGEGANALRADAQDLSGKRYRLEIESLRALPGLDWIYAVTLRLNSEMGDAGDVLVRLNWRGMASNRVRLSIGHAGGGPKDDDGARPTPAPLIRPKPWQDEEEQARFSRPFAPDNVRFLEQASFGVTFASELQLRRVGINRWLEDQTTQLYSSPTVPRYSTFPYPDTSLFPTNIDTTTCPSTCVRDNYTMYRLQNWMFKEALYGEEQQLRRRVSWALSQIFVVSGRETQQPSHLLPYLQILDRNAFGSYRQLLYEMTLNPAMGNYLDMVRSTQADPNENYAREVLQLFSIGLDKLNLDGTPMLDPMGNRIPTYDQSIVNNFTKVFTGWNFCNTGCPNSVAGRVNYIDPMKLVPAEHDSTQKILLNYPGAVPTIPAGIPVNDELGLTIDNIFNHPNVGPFIGRALIQQLVTSNPSPAYVQRVATVFNDNGHGERGNLKDVVLAILLDPEARGDIKTDPDYGHLKEPVLLVTSLLRPFDPKSANRTVISDGVINGITLSLDQDVFNAPSVFNYFPPDYIAPNTTILGPEFAIVTTGTTLKRPNFVNQMLFAGGIPVNAANNIPNGTSIVMDRLVIQAQLDPTGGELVDTCNRLMMHGAMPPAMRASIMQAVQAVSPTDFLKRARTAVYLVATSSQNQVQR